VPKRHGASGSRHRREMSCLATYFGCRQAADARLPESRDLSVQQSMLTGESRRRQDGFCRRRLRLTPQPIRTRPISCFSAGRSSAEPERGSRSRQARRRCSATSRCGLGAVFRKQNFEHGLRRFSLLILRTTVVLVLCSSS